MKTLNIVLWILCYTCFPQLRISFEDYSINENGDVQIVVFAQNLGSSTRIWALYGDMDKSNGAYRYGVNFFLKYDNRRAKTSIKNIPSSIVIKTVFGGQIPMDHPFYDFPSTGLDAGQTWKILFTQVPANAENVFVSILGYTYKIGDMPLAEADRIKSENLIKEGLINARTNAKRARWDEAAAEWENILAEDKALGKKYSDEIYIAFNEKALKSAYNKKLKEAIHYYDMAAELHTEANNSYATTMSKIICEFANSYARSNSLLFSIELFEKARKIDSVEFKNYISVYDETVIKYGREQITLGIEEINKGDINSGVSIINNISRSNTILTNESKEALESFKKSYFLYCAANIFPGVGTILADNSELGFYQSLLVTTFALAAIVPPEQPSEQSNDETKLRMEVFYFMYALMACWSTYSTVNAIGDYNAQFNLGNNDNSRVSSKLPSDFKVSFRIQL